MKLLLICAGLFAFTMAVPIEKDQSANSAVLSERDPQVSFSILYLDPKS